MSRPIALFIRALIALFPHHFRAQYGEEMREVFFDRHRAAAATGRRAMVRHLFVCAWKMPLAAWREHRPEPHTRRTPPMLERLTSDLRFTFRSLARAPLFVVVTVAVIAIGIGGVATIASGMNALVLRPLPGTTDGLSLYTIDRRTEDASEGVSISGDLYRHLRDHTRALDGLAVWSRVALAMRTEHASLNLAGNIVSDNYFDVLGARPAAGRFFAAGDTTPTVVISHLLWTQQFNRSQAAVGQTVSVNGRPYTIAGVAPEGFRGVFTPLRIDAWVPLHTQPHVRPGRDLALAPWLWMFGRLAPGISETQARAELKALLPAWMASSSDTFVRYTDVRFTPLTGLPSDARAAIFTFSGILLTGAVIVLLVAGANVSSLLAARATSRRHEMGVRTALGAGRARLIRQLLTETILLFVAGSIGGVGLAWIGTSALERLPIPTDTGLHLELSPDWRVMAGAAALGLLAALIFGLAPALKGATVHPTALIRASTAGAGTRSNRLTSCLIVGQLAGSLVLLSITALLMTAVTRGEHATLGFQTDNIHTAVVNTEAFGYDEARGQAFHASLTRELLTTPGVRNVAVASVAPLVSTPSNATITVTTGSEATRMQIAQTTVGPRFFETLGIPLTTGREFAETDMPDSPRVAIVNQRFAERAWPDNADVVGNTFDRGTTRYTVVGVAGDVKWRALDEPPAPFAYFPVAQQWTATQTMFVQADAGVRPAIVIAEATRRFDAAIPTPAVSTLADDITVALFPQRVAAAITSALGAGALLLAAAGLYGTLAYLVSSRTREIGVRLALGATRQQIVRHFLRHGLMLTTIGLVMGLIGSALVAPLASSLLLGASPFDIMAFSSAAVLLAVVAALAAFVPARRASGVNPVQVLRG